MKLVNKTEYSSRDLRKFFLAGLKAEGARTNKYILVKYKRGPGIHGCATIGHYGEENYIEMKLPLPKHGPPQHAYVRSSVHS